MSVRVSTNGEVITRWFYCVVRSLSVESMALDWESLWYGLCIGMGRLDLASRDGWREAERWIKFADLRQADEFYAYEKSLRTNADITGAREVTK